MQHPELRENTTEKISKGRSVITEESIRKWFRELKEFLAENNSLEIFDGPSRIFNGDETAFCSKTEKVIGPKGWKNVYSIQFGNEKETITVLLTFAAKGALARPMIVFPYVRLPKEAAKAVPEDWVIGNSDSGWMKSQNFYDYISNSFNSWLDQNHIQKTVLLLGHKSHLNIHTSKFCDKKESFYMHFHQTRHI